MWCTRHSAHVSSTYSLISSIAGVGIATVGASKVQWGWNKGKGLGAIFAGLGMAPTIAAGFGATIFMLIKVVVHMRRDPVRWAIFTSPFFFLIAGTICTLSIVYKGSPKLGLNKKPSWYVASVVMGVGCGLAILAAIFFVPYLYAKVIKKDSSVRWYHVFLGPALFTRAIQSEDEQAVVPNYAVVQEDDLPFATPATLVNGRDSGSNEKVNPSDLPELTLSSPQQSPTPYGGEEQQKDYATLMREGRERFHSKLRTKRGPLGWAMRYLHDNQRGPGAIYETKNMMTVIKRVPAQITVGALYGLHYDIHAAQAGIHGTPEGARMERVYSHAKKYPNEVEHTYSFVQIITACTASFAHGANDIGNSVGPWAVIYGAWSTGNAAAAKAPVPIWQLAVLSLTISLGLITYGYNIMAVMGNKITYHSPSRGSSMEMGE
jgi:sodium-dependent phosphate transporter